MNYFALFFKTVCLKEKSHKIRIDKKFMLDRHGLGPSDMAL